MAAQVERKAVSIDELLGRADKAIARIQSESDKGKWNQALAAVSDAVIALQCAERELRDRKRRGR